MERLIIEGDTNDMQPNIEQPGRTLRTMNESVSWLFRRVGYLSSALLLLLPRPGASVPASPTGHQPDARTTLESHFEAWRSLMQRRDSLGEDGFHAAVGALLGEAFALDAVAAEVLAGPWAKLTTYERSTFIAALRSSLANKILTHLGEDEQQSLPTLSFQSVDGTDKAATLLYSLGGHTEGRPFTIHMRKSSGVWRITDVEFGGTGMLSHYRDYCNRVLSEYSFPYLVAEVGDDPAVILEDFEASPVGKLPVGWSWKGKDDKKRKPYRVREEDGNKYLEATDEGESVIIGKDVKWNLHKYPYVSFRWRAHKLPLGADERFDDKIDSGAGIYFLYREILGLIPESVKYVWSSTLPVGSAMQRSGVGKPWMIVAESGEEHLGVWRTYVFNLYEAYQKTFGGSPPNRPIGIGILSDGNTVKSQAFADYDDIRALRSADPGVDSGVHEILKAN